MKKLDYASLVLSVVSLVWIISMLQDLPASAKPVVSLQSEPALSEVVPFGELVQLRLVAQDNQGKPLQANAKISLRAPDPTPWFTSDFPWVEGTPLLNLAAPLVNGELAWSQVMPIRGQYDLTVDFTPIKAGAFEPFQESLTLKVPENPVKYRNVLLLIGVLVGVGGAGGWIIGRNASPQALGLPEPVQRILIGGVVITAAALLVVNISAELAEGHTHAEHPTEPETALSAQAKNPIALAQLEGEHHAVVGQPLRQTVTVKPTTGQSLSDIMLTVKAVDTESSKVMFSYTRPMDNQGQFSWDFQFFDAAPHQVLATLRSAGQNAFPPIELGHDIEVQGKEPPLSVRFITLGYWLGLFAIASLVGYHLALRSTKTAS